MKCELCRGQEPQPLINLRHMILCRDCFLMEEQKDRAFQKKDKELQAQKVERAVNEAWERNWY